MREELNKLAIELNNKARLQRTRHSVRELRYAFKACRIARETLDYLVEKFGGISDIGSYGSAVERLGLSLESKGSELTSVGDESGEVLIGCADYLLLTLKSNGLTRRDVAQIVKPIVGITVEEVEIIKQCRKIAKIISTATLEGSISAGGLVVASSLEPVVNEMFKLLGVVPNESLESEGMTAVYSRLNELARNGTMYDGVSDRVASAIDKVTIFD